MRKHGTVKAVTISIIAALAIGLPAAAASARPVKPGMPVQLVTGSDPHEICNVFSNGGLDQCLNNWNGADGYVKTYSSGVANDAFIVQGVDRCGNGDHTTYGCPISGVPSGLFIYQIEFGDGSGYCIGTDASGNALSTTCNNPNNGYGGGNGTLEVAYNDGTCPSGTNAAINVYWTNKNGGWSAIRGISWPTNSDGTQVILNGAQIIYCLGYYSY
jgi:hypothetical protein